MAQRTLRQNEAVRQAHQTAQGAETWLVWLGRLGFASKGVVYVLIGVLAAQTALGSGGETTDSQGVLARVYQQPFGQLLLGIIALGLVGYALWRFIQAAFDTQNKGDDLKGWGARAGYVVSGVIHATLAFTAFKLLQSGSANTSGESGTQDWVARLLAQPFGPWLVGAVGVALLGSAAFQFLRAYRANFKDNLRLGEMSAEMRKWAVRTGRFGYAARGVTFAIMGVFVIVAAFQNQPEEARGVAGSLDTLARQPYGTVLLGIVALGFVAYGLYMFVEARHRRMVID